MHRLDVMELVECFHDLSPDDQASLLQIARAMAGRTTSNRLNDVLRDYVAEKLSMPVD